MVHTEYPGTDLSIFFKLFKDDKNLLALRLGYMFLIYKI
jgi:hypothetical protein